MKKPVYIISVDDFSEEINGYLQSDFHERLEALLELNNCIIENGIIINIADDFYLNFIRLLNKYKVEYLITGGFAVNFYGYPRNTHGMDLWINPHANNSKKLLCAIDEFGYDSSILKELHLNEIEAIKLPHDRNPFKKIEILAGFSGAYDFSKSFADRSVVEYNGVQMSFIPYHDLIAGKTGSLKFKDIDDIRVLYQIAGKEEYENNFEANRTDLLGQ